MRNQGLECRVGGLRSRVQGSGFRAQSSGFRVCLVLPAAVAVAQRISVVPRVLGLGSMV